MSMKNFKENLLKELFILQDKYDIDLSDRIDLIFSTETPEYRKIFELEYKLEKVSNLVDYIFTKIEDTNSTANIMKDELKRNCLYKAIDHPLKNVYRDIENDLKIIRISKEYC